MAMIKEKPLSKLYPIPGIPVIPHFQVGASIIFVENFREPHVDKTWRMGTIEGVKDQVIQVKERCGMIIEINTTTSYIEISALPREPL